MQELRPRFAPLAAKTAVCHTITYFVMGAHAFHFLHYSDFINDPKSGMRPVTSMWVILGPPLQVFRGVLFAAVFYPFRDRLFGRRNEGLVGATRDRKRMTFKSPEPYWALRRRLRSDNPEA
jgi:hypothetical protein